MPFVLLGVLLVLLNLLGVGFAASWQWPGDWWKMLWPFGLAVLWWAYADRSGLTKRREMAKMEQRRLERRRKSMEGLGLDPRRREQLERSERAARKAAARKPSRYERQQAERDRRNRETITRSSRFDGASSSFDK